MRHILGAPARKAGEKAKKKKKPETLSVSSLIWGQLEKGKSTKKKKAGSSGLLGYILG